MPILIQQHVSPSDVGLMGDADRMVHYGGICIDTLIDIYAPHELEERAGWRALRIDRFADKMDRHRIISAVSI